MPCLYHETRETLSREEEFNRKKAPMLSQFKTCKIRADDKERFETVISSTETLR